MAAWVAGRGRRSWGKSYVAFTTQST